MSRQTHGFLALLLIAATLQADGPRIHLVARDLEGRPASGLRFMYERVKSRPTSRAGATELDLPADHRSGQQIKILLVPSPQAEDWFPVNPRVNIPDRGNSATVVLMRRSAFRQLAAEARDAPRQAALGQKDRSAEDRKRLLIEAAARRGLSAEQLETAILSFAETQDPKDKGIAAYLKGQYSEAEVILGGAVDKQAGDFVETQRYLGAAQYEQGKYRAAIETFRKALTFRGDDADLLSRLGKSLRELAEWRESESLLRQALAIDEECLETDHPAVAIHLDNLAVLLLLTNRHAEAEPLLRRALAIDEKNFGTEHPNVARDLNDLAVLLGETHRLAEAEPMLRRAFAIDEKSFETDHPSVARDLESLAELLWAAQRLDEAEPLLRQALGIHFALERRSGYEHPKQAKTLQEYRGLLKELGKSDTEIEATIEELARPSK